MNTIAHIRRFSFGRLLLIGIAVGLPFAAQAGEPARAEPTGVDIVVNYADLDLSEPDGARTLYARLKRAAGKACGHRPSPLELREFRAFQDCYDSALTKAVQRVDSKQLYALHSGRGRQATMG